MKQAPRYCRPAAYELFTRELPTLEETNSLVRAAIAVSMHELNDIDLAQVELTFSQIAQEINGRVSSGSPHAMVAQLHEVLFEEWGFNGHAENYYVPENSYLPRVLETRRGIPVTLSLIYKTVAQQIGLKVRGINSPVHFLAAVEIDGSWMIVDAFAGGRVLTCDEVYERLEQLTGGSVPRCDSVLATATHPQWLARIVRNLEQIFSRSNRQSDALAMQELLALIKEAD